jgi:excisionase family DNA binding protein
MSTPHDDSTPIEPPSAQPRAWPPLCVDVPTAAALISVSRSSMYELLRDGVIPSGAVRIGGRLRINVRALETWIEQLAAEADGPHGSGPKPPDTAFGPHRRPRGR